MKSSLTSFQVFFLLFFCSETQSQKPPSVRPEGVDSQDLNIGESHAAFSYLIPPPRIATTYNGGNREWRHISENSPFRSVWNPTTGYDAKQSFPTTNHKININYPLERLSIKRQTPFHPPPLSNIPTPDLSFNPYVRLNDKEIYRSNRPHPSRYQPHSGFSNFHLDSQKPTREPENPKRERHYTSEPSSRHIQRGHLIFRQNDDLSHGSDGQRDDSTNDKEENRAVEEGSPNKTREEEPSSIDREKDRHPYISPDHLDKSELVNSSTPTQRTSFLQPGNLAALLAGAHSLGSKSSESDAGPIIISSVESTIEPTPTKVDDLGLKKGRTSKTRTSVPIERDEHKPETTRVSRARTSVSSKVDEHESKTDGTSRTRTSVPEHIMRHDHYSSSEYYDELYDEFLDFYYDADGRSNGRVKDFKKFVEEKRRGNVSPKEDQNDGTTGGLRNTTLHNLHSLQHKNIRTSTSKSTSSNTLAPTSQLISSTPKFPFSFKTPISFDTRETTSTLSSTSSLPTSFANISTVEPSTPPPVFTLIFSTLVATSSTTSRTPTTSASPVSTLRTTTSKTEKNKEALATSRRPTRPSPISLSEILQELGLSLPQFLGTLALHGSSLKDFTEKLRTKSISKAEFRRAKGNVKRLLEILESSPSTPQKTTFTKQDLTTTTPSITTRYTTSDETLFSITTLKKPETTTRASPNPPHNKTQLDDKPLIFGSRSSGVSLTKLESAIPRSEEKPNNSSYRTKPSIVVELDIAKLVKEKGVSASAILQDFKTMFNISETTVDEQNKTEPTTSKSPQETTTKHLRPYKKQSYRPYRPLRKQMGNSKIHRGVINHRLSSTSRPTLRPPYIPPPPSINFGESIEDVAWNNFYKKNTTKLANGSNKEFKNPKREDKTLREEWDENYELSNYKIIKIDPDSLDVSTRSAIMAAGILGGVALSVFIAIFVVVKYRNHTHRNRRRIPLSLPSDSSSSSLPPLYASRSGNVTYGKECYQTSGFWTSLKKKFDPYSPSSSPTSM